MVLAPWSAALGQLGNWVVQPAIGFGKVAEQVVSAVRSTTGRLRLGAVQQVCGLGLSGVVR